MAWRVSWAALWAALMGESPTLNTKNAPRNTHTAPAAMRCETFRETVEVLTVVMDTLRATVIVWGSRPGSCTAGLLTSRVAGFMCAFPVSQWHSSHKTSPLTVAGAVTVLAPFGSSAPCSLLGPSSYGFWAPSQIVVPVHRPFRQLVSGPYPWQSGASGLY